jgi:copper chaperone CopZ
LAWVIGLSDAAYGDDQHSICYTPAGYSRGGPMSEITYTVPDISCGHCKHAVSTELTHVAGVDSVEVELDTKLVTVRGHELNDAALRAAIEEAGYKAA